MNGAAQAKTPSPLAFAGAFAAVYLIWGSTYFAIRVGVSALPPFLLAGTRFLAAGAILAAWLAGARGFRLTKRQWRDNAVTGVLLLAGGNGMVCWSEQSLPSGVTTLIISLIPLLVVLGEWALPRGARPSAATFLGIGLGFAGLLLLAGPGGAAAADPKHCAGVLAACLSWSAGSLYARHAREPADPLTGAAAQMLCAGGVLTLAGWLAGEAAHFSSAQMTAPAVAAWIYLVLAGSLVGYTCFVWLLKHSTPTRASTYAYVNPVVAVFLGWWLLGEPVTARTLTAAAVIIAGVAIITGLQGRTKRRA